MIKKNDLIDETNLNINERKIADNVADELLAQEKKEKKLVLFFLLLFILLVFVLSYLIFSRFAIFSKNIENAIQSGSIVFSYEEGTNQINIEDAVAVTDEVGKSQTSSNTFFEFDVAIKINSNIQTEVTYEMSITPNVGTLDEKYVRVVLLEEGKEVLINGKNVNKVSELKSSEIRKDAKFLYKKTITKESRYHYVFKMWVGEDYELDSTARTFSCYVNIDAY